MREDWLRNIPINIRNELNELNLTISSIWGGEEAPSAVSTTLFIQKENKDVIKKLIELGWYKYDAQIIYGVKYVSYKKVFNTKGR